MDTLPSEIIQLIYKKLMERDRRNLKMVSRYFYNCYCVFVVLTKHNPPGFLRLCGDGCNLYQGVVYHDCVCVYQRLVEWENY